MGVPTIGITDTNANPLIITHPIPANDDAVGSLKLIISYIIDAWIEGRKEMGKIAEKAAKDQAEAAEKEAKAAAKVVEKQAKDAVAAKRAGK